MFRYIFLIFILFAWIKKSDANEKLYITEFHNIEINNEVIIDAKIREINKIKKLSFNNILSRILNDNELYEINTVINLDKDIDFLIKNIIIENEYISDEKYKAEVKINYNYFGIVDLLRSHNINYSDTISPNFLLIVAEQNDLSIEGLNSNNLFYKSDILYKSKIVNILKPDLSNNDRFIMPYEKIKQKDINSLKKMSVKYKTNLIFIIIFKSLNDTVYLDINLFSNDTNNIVHLQSLNLNSKINYQLEFIEFANEWWKNKNLINNSIINKLTCNIKNLNINQLYYINSKIESISQVKSNIVKKISFTNNQQEIIFYGELNSLINKLINNGIDLMVNSENICTISIKN